MKYQPANFGGEGKCPANLWKGLKVKSSVNNLDNFPIHYQRIHGSFLRKITIDLLYF